MPQQKSSRHTSMRRETRSLSSLSKAEHVYNLGRFYINCGGSPIDHPLAHPHKQQTFVYPLRKMCSATDWTETSKRQLTRLFHRQIPSLIFNTRTALRCFFQICSTPAELTRRCATAAVLHDDNYYTAVTSSQHASELTGDAACWDGDAAKPHPAFLCGCDAENKSPASPRCSLPAGL